MYLVVIAWVYVALMMAVAEATSSTGTVLGALVTFVLYCVLPLSLVVYLMATPARRRARQRRESAETPDGSGHAPRVAETPGVAPVREET